MLIYIYKGNLRHLKGIIRVGKLDFFTFISELGRGFGKPYKIRIPREKCTFVKEL